MTKWTESVWALRRRVGDWMFDLALWIMFTKWGKRRSSLGESEKG